MSRTSVTFDSAGVSLAGHYYVPDDDGAAPRPAIVVSHPGSGVKEQAAGLYAQRLADKGFVTLVFDAAYQGESGGEPRGMEDPPQRVEDIKAAVSYLTTRDEVDVDRIGAFGICAGGGYVLPATASDHRIKAVAAVSAVDIARQLRLGADGAQDPRVFQGLTNAAARARTTEAEGKEPTTLRIFPDTEDQARQLGGEHGAEGFQYYCTPLGFHQRSAKFFAWSSIDKMAILDAFASVPLIGQRPLLLVIGTRAVTSWMGVDAFQRATGPKEIYWIDGATHVSLYYKEDQVGPAVEKIATFFTEKLVPSRAVASR
jgi:fermentation-respiration switch protein FrsA (DUF1100 family)